MMGSMMRRAMIGDSATLNVDFTSMTNGGQLANAGFTFTNATTTARTYINSNGVLATATTNEPRFDHDPTTLAPRGLLIEGTATNLMSYSEDFSNAAWTKSGTNGTMPLTGTAPDNNAASRLLEENTTSYAKHSLERSISISAGIHTFSVWLKEPSTNSRRYAHIQLADGQATAARYTIVADLQTGTIAASGANNGTAGAPTGTGHSITAYPGGWYRVTISMNHVASPSYTTIVLGDSASLFGGSNQPFYSATTPYKGLLVWGAQFEAGSGASSYIPTGASTVQRLADNCEITGTNFSSWWPNPTAEFTVLWTGDMTRIPPASAQFMWLCRASGTSKARAYVTTGSVIRANSSVFDFTASPATTATANTVFKSAMAVKSGDSAMYVNSGSVIGSQTDASTGTTTNHDSLYFNPNADNFMHIRVFKFWPTRLSNATMQGLVS